MENDKQAFFTIFRVSVVCISLTLAPSQAVRLAVCQHVPLGSNPTQPWTNKNSCSSLKILKGQTSTRNHWPHPDKWLHRFLFWVSAAAAFCFLLHNQMNKNMLTAAHTIQISPWWIFIITLLITYCWYCLKSHINRNLPFVVQAFVNTVKGTWGKGVYQCSFEGSVWLELNSSWSCLFRK